MPAEVSLLKDSRLGEPKSVTIVHATVNMESFSAAVAVVARAGVYPDSKTFVYVSQAPAASASPRGYMEL